MKKILKKLIIYSLPFLILFGMFVAFEPYDYFGMRNGKSDYLCKPLSSVRELLLNHPENIVLGDSRMANLNMELAESFAGEPYTMLGFGGAQTGELIELFWYATEHTELKKVIFGVNLYTTIDEQGPGRIPSVIEQAEDPAKFILHAGHWLGAINALKTSILNAVWSATGHPERMEFPEDPTDYSRAQDIPAEMGEKYRLNLEEYCKLLRSNMGISPEVRQETVDKLKEVVEYCDANGIEIIFVYPPIHISVYEMYEDMDVLKEAEKYKSYLRSVAKVYDFEFPNSFTENDDNFYDGFHLPNTVKPYLVELIFTDLEADCVRRTEP
ncbi:MAG: hypothetical protein IJ091_07220 [Oscillospiraceae bacterium]|nr:hypothetical protein [Oscillospiraceae bacterium]